jgi:GntR family transcriptional regulator
MIELRLDEHSGLSTYLQVAHQVRQAMRLGCLLPGDRLPTVREVVAILEINPNTVLKAYRELEREGLISSRPGTGTFVLRGLWQVTQATQDRLIAELTTWVATARDSHPDDDYMRALFEHAIKQGKPPHSTRR